jgi:hypothetical protein
MDTGIAGLGAAIWGPKSIPVSLSSQRVVVSIRQNQLPFVYGHLEIEDLKRGMLRAGARWDASPEITRVYE